MLKYNSTTLPTTAKRVFKMSLALATMLLCSCSNDLSRQKAAELIARQQKLPAIETIQLGKSYLKESRHDSWGVCMVIGDKYSDSGVKERLDGLQAKGLISIGEKKQHEGECNYVWATVELTDEGKKYLVKDGDGEYQIKVNELTFGEITGIQIHEQFKTAEADYTVRKINLTPFGGNISTAPMNRRATFALFDDGWRIK
ncbi:MAG: hypothetical protein AABN33_01020 [Acidobacteriota bacterium]